MGISKKKTSKATTNAKLSSPIEMAHHRLLAFFKDDEDIVVADSIDYDTYTLDITVSDVDKFAALKKILKTHYSIGNMTLDINIIYQEKDEDTEEDSRDEIIDAFRTVLDGNPLFKEFDQVKDPLTGVEFDYCIFEKQVVQYFDDELNDPHGLRSTLAQYMAMEIFDIPAIMYCTSTD